MTRYLILLLCLFFSTSPWSAGTPIIKVGVVLESVLLFDDFLEKNNFKSEDWVQLDKVEGDNVSDITNTRLADVIGFSNIKYHRKENLIEHNLKRYLKVN